jgi:hypothetical protein
MTIIVQVTETTENDSILVHKPKMFYGFSDPEFLSYVNDKVGQELNPPNMAEWELEEVINDLANLKVSGTSSKRGRPKGSKGKKKVHLIDEKFVEMEIDDVIVPC